MSLIRESASQRDLGQGCIRLKQVLCGKRQATADHESMRWLAKCARKRAGEVRFAELDNCAEISNENSLCNMAIDIVTHLPHLPCQQAPSCNSMLLHRLRVNLLLQKARRLQYGALRTRVFVAKLSSGRIQQGNDMVHPLLRSFRTCGCIHQRLCQLSFRS